jgi:hypothetical protein
LRVLLTGLALLICSIATDVAGSSLQSLALLVVSFAIGIAGAVVAFRGMIEFLGELV